MKNTLKKSIVIVLNLLLVLVVILGTVLITSVISSKKKGNLSGIFGYSPVVVLSDSMKGKEKTNFSAGDLIILKKADTDHLKVGDIISFYEMINGKMQLNTHRIIAIDTSSGLASYQTKGDNNPAPDKELKSASDVEGQFAFKIAGAGRAINFLSNKWGFLICFVVPVFAFFIWRLIKLVIDVTNFKNSKKENKTE